MFTLLLIFGSSIFSTNLIPGVPSQYIPEQGMIAAVALQAKLQANAYWIYLISIAISLGLYTLKLGEIKVEEIISSGLITLALIFSMNIVFGGIMKIGDSMAEQLYAKEDMSKLNEKFREAANKKDDGSTENAQESTWFGQMTKFLKYGAASGGVLISELLMIIGTLLFYISSVVMNLIWRALVIVLFVTAPILIPLGAIPGWGTKIQSAWLGGVVQMSAWQIWMALWGWFVASGDTIFAISYDPSSSKALLNHFESVAIAYVSTLLCILGPVFINALFPISSFASSATVAIAASTKIVSKVIDKGKAAAGAFK